MVNWPMFKGYALIAVTALLVSCAGVVNENAFLEEPGESPVIGTLQLRDRGLTITSTEEGVRYRITDGLDTSALLTVEELEARAPELAEVIQSATAARQLRLNGRVEEQLAPASRAGLRDSRYYYPARR
jgi:hypothetical protein